ncbi:MAG: hypothetical protein WBY97_19610 [Roseiarcus sp.]
MHDLHGAPHLGLDPGFRRASPRQTEAHVIRHGSCADRAHRSKDHCDVAVFRGKIVDDALFISMLLRRGGDAFTIAWDREAMPHTICSILDNGDRRAAAFAIPATCEPKGYTAEKRKGNLRICPSRSVARFVSLIGYVDKASAGSAARGIEGSAE